jgi:hypothetical protein
MEDEFMGKSFHNETEKRLCLNGFFVVAALLALYGVSCLVAKSWQIHTDDFGGIIEIAVCSLAVSAIWLSLYWFLDRIKHESLRMTLDTFLLGIASYTAGRGMLFWFVGENIPAMIESVFLPGFSFFIVFMFVVVKFDSFDEFVDAFIYGGFLGTGIAFASCMSRFSHYRSFDGQFVILTLITNISVYAAICSLSGFLLHQSALRKKYFRFVLFVLAMFSLFALNQAVIQILIKDLSYADLKILPVLIAVAFAVVLVSVVVFLIHKVLSAEETGAIKFEAISVSSIPHFVAFCLSAFVLVCAFSARFGSLRTDSFVSPDEKWSFELPYGWRFVSDSSKTSIFEFSSSNEDSYYKNASGTVSMHVVFDSEKSVGADDSSACETEYGWRMAVCTNSFLSEDSLNNPVVVHQKTYRLGRGGCRILVDTYSNSEADREEERAVRIFMKTLLEAKK